MSLTRIATVALATLATLAPLAAGVGLSACGSSAGSTHSAGSDSRSAIVETVAGITSTVPITPTMMAGGYAKDDADGDNDDENGRQHKSTANDDAATLAEYGHPVAAAERRQIEAVVKRYYAAAVAGNGAVGCSLLFSSLAAALANGQSQSTPSGRAACAAAAAKMFDEKHQHWVSDEVATMVVPSVNVRGQFGLAVLGFHTQPEGKILVQREGHAWKLGALLDSEMP
jgi:hypothetical protein